MCNVYIHKLACKGTKKIPHMQAYAGNSAFFLFFGIILGCFGQKKQKNALV